MVRVKRLVAGPAILLLLAGVVLVGASEQKNFVANLRGDHEVPPVETDGNGVATFHLSNDGTSLRYRLVVNNLEGVTQSHIHIAPADQNGAVVVFLFGFDPAGVSSNGLLAEGVITEADLVGPLAGEPLEALVARLQSGLAYVNVHTLANPSGEIRGQIR